MVVPLSCRARGESAMKRNPFVCLRTECLNFIGTEAPCLTIHMACIMPQKRPDFCEKCKWIQQLPKDCRYSTEHAVSQDANLEHVEDESP